MDLFKRTQKNYRFPKWFSDFLDKKKEDTGNDHTKILIDSTCKANKWKEPKKPK